MNDRFILQKSQTRQNGWVCTDADNGIICEFEEQKFNETHKFTILEDIDCPDALALAKIAREMADWLRENHDKKAMP